MGIIKMKLSFAVALLIGAVVAKGEDPAKGKDYFTSDPRRGTSDAPLLRAPIGGMAKPTKEFKVPKNKEAEPPLSTTMDPTDYESGSGKTYHDKKTASKAKDEGPKKPETPAGINESTETAGTTTLWKVNSNDSPDPPKKKDDEEETPTKAAKVTKKKDTEEAETPKETAKESADKETKEDMKAAEKAVAKAEKEEKAEKKETAEKEEKAEKKKAAKEEVAAEEKEVKATKKKAKSKETEDAPESKSFIQTETTTGCEPAIDVS